MRWSVLILIAIGFCAVASAQRSEKACPNDLKWMLNYAAPNDKSAEQNERLTSLPCFRAAIRKAFPQHHSLVANDIPLAEAAEIYTTVYGAGPQKRDHRYITIEGCVPHDCPDTGMIWIDTQSNGAIVFAASDEIVTYPLTPKSFSNKFHLWIYSTLPPLDTHDAQPLPTALIESLNEVYAHEEIASVTLIQPDGKLQSVTPATFHIQSSQQQPAR